MSEFFESGESENIFASNARGLRQRNAVIGILIAIIAVLVAILFVKGCDDDDSPSSIPVIVEQNETEDAESQGSEDTPPEAATEGEDDNTDEEEVVVEPTPLPDDPESLILLGDYAWLDPSRSEATIALQELLEIEADGWYGMGTRAAHLAALEERGLPTEYAATCDLTVGEALCAVQPGVSMEDALVSLTGGLGEADSQTEWVSCYTEEEQQESGYFPMFYQVVSWGPINGYFIKGERSAANGGAWGPNYSYWSLTNTFLTSEGDWGLPFPSEVRFAESTLLDWNEADYSSEDPVSTGTVVPSGVYIAASKAEFEENIGHEFATDQNLGQSLIITDQYKIALDDNNKWTWATDSLEACG